jgi:hypothetical protein
MPALSAYANTENTSMVILEKKGYRTWYDDTIEMYGCVKNGWDFLATSITELLGVVGIYEFHGSPQKYEEYWWQINEPWLIENIENEKPSYKPVWEK